LPDCVDRQSVRSPDQKCRESRTNTEVFRHKEHGVGVSPTIDTSAASAARIVNTKHLFQTSECN
jgi:hypothetical protein